MVEGDKLYQMNAQVRSIMSKRKSPEARKSTYEFFKTLYNSIEQEMLREEDPNSTACRDPYVEKLLENLLVSVGKMKIYLGGGVRCDVVFALLARTVIHRFRTILEYRVTNGSIQSYSND